MSTSDGLPSGLPDPQLMAAWANEFFRGVGSEPAQPEAVVGTAPPEVGNAAWSQLPAVSNAPQPQLPAASNAALPSLPSASNAAGLPSLPGGIGAGALPSVPSWQVPVQVPVVAPIPQAPPFGPDPSPAGYYFLERTEARRAVPTNPEPYTRPLTAASGPVPRAPAFASQPLTTPSAAPPANAALANGMPLAAQSGALPIMAGSGEPAWSAAQPALAGVPGVAGMGTPFPTTGAGIPPVPDALPQLSAARSLSLYEFSPVVMPEDLGRRQFDVETIRADFPILREVVNNKRLVWLDNAATTQKPQSVIDRISFFYEHENSNVHRGAHTLAARSTDAYEAARETARRFLNAPSLNDIVFVRGTTEAINLVAFSWGKRNLQPGDEIVITWLEHHSNIVPWQLLCSQTGAKLKVAPVDERGQILLDEYERLFTSRTRLASFTQVSNALGTVLPVKEMTEIAHRWGARVLVDGAQAVSHMRVDVQALDCDFYAFSGHKVFGPTGIGVLYGKSDLLAAMPPWQGGGSMIIDVMFDKTIYSPPPARFEAGTGNIADAVGLGAALDYVERIGMENIARHEHELLEYGTARLLSVPRVRLIGTAAEKAGVLGFVIDGVPTEQVGQHLAKDGIAVRAGHHCAQPALRRYGLEATVRPSLALYNSHADIDALIESLLRLQASSG